jgi:hypothetical protein
MTDIRRSYWTFSPHHPSIVELARRLSVLEGVSGVNCTSRRLDQETRASRSPSRATPSTSRCWSRTISESGAVIHSVDSVSAGKKLVEEVETPQDR